MTRIVGTLRDVYKNATTNEAMLVIAYPRIGGALIREHINIRERDLTNATVSNIRIGCDVVVNADVSKYFHNNTWKSNLVNITSIKGQ